MAVKRKLTGREKRLLVVGVPFLAGILWSYVMLLVVPLTKRVIILGKEVQRSQQELTTLETMTANESTMQGRYQDLQQIVRSLEELLPGEESLPTLIGTLSDLASQTHVRIQTIVPKRAEKEASEEEEELYPSVYTEVPIQINAQAGFHQFGAFLSLVEAQKVPINVATLKVTTNPKDPKRHLIKLLLNAYFSAEIEKKGT